MSKELHEFVHTVILIEMIALEHLCAWLQGTIGQLKREVMLARAALQAAQATSKLPGAVAPLLDKQQALLEIQASRDISGAALTNSCLLSTQAADPGKQVAMAERCYSGLQEELGMETWMSVPQMLPAILEAAKAQPALAVLVLRTLQHSSQADAAFGDAR